MRKIFSILVVLMMVAGTFVSCSMPTNDTPADSTNAADIEVKDIPNCDLSYLILANGKKAICTDEVRILIDAASDKQSALNVQRKINIRDSEPAGWADDVYDVSGGWITDARWCIGFLSINDTEKDSNTINTNLGFDIKLPKNHIHQ